MTIHQYLLKAKTPKTWTPYLILVYSLFITVLSSFYVSETTHKNNQLRFINQVTLFEDNINDKISTYTALLLGTRGLFAAEFNIDNNDFSRYVNSLELNKRYLGITNIGFIRRLPPDSISNAQEQYDLSFPISSKEIYPIVFIEPTENFPTNDFRPDTAELNHWRLVMERARDTGSPTATDHVEYKLIPSLAGKKGFTIVVPIYSSQTVPPTQEERRSQLVGFVFSAFEINNFISRVLGDSDNRYLDFSIYTASADQPQYLLYQTPEFNSNSAPNYSITRQINIAGKTWSIEYFSASRFEAYFDRYIGEFIFVLGVIISFVLFALSRSQYKARSAVEKSAMKVVQSEQALQAANQKMTQILESIADGFFSVDNQWQCTYLNFEGSRLLNLNRKNAYGKNIWTLIPKDSNEELIKFLKEAMNKQKPSSLELHQSNNNSWLLLRAYPSKEGLTVYIQDISQRKQLENQKDEFMGIASHELKTPVTSIKAYAQVLYRRFVKEGNQAAAQLLLKMDNQVDKLTSLISDLLDATKIDAGKLKLSREKFSINKLIDEVAEEMQRTTEQHHIKIKGKSDCQVYADRDRISQILVNFLSNAIKYSPEAKVIDIEVGSHNHLVTVCVKDYGIGIPKKLQKNIFKRFFRVEGAKELTFPGLGLGLYICSEIINRHKGTISLESESGQGSKFCFSLPCEHVSSVNSNN